MFVVVVCIRQDYDVCQMITIICQSNKPRVVVVKMKAIDGDDDDKTKKFGNINKILFYDFMRCEINLRPWCSATVACS